MSRRVVRGRAEEQHDVVLVYEPGAVLGADVDWLASYLGSAIESGSRFQHSETLLIGIVECVFVSDGSEALVLCEPDFRSIPIKYTRSVTQALQILRAQRMTVESFGLAVQPAFPSILQGSVVCSLYRERPVGRLVRFQEAGAASGWYVECSDSAHDHTEPSNLGRVSVYDVLIHHRSVAGFLALPPDSEVTFSGSGNPVLSFGGAVYDVLPGSFLDARAGW